MKTLNLEAEVKFNSEMREVTYNAMLQLRDTLQPKFTGKDLGYKNADHARLMIVKFTVKQMDKMASDHLRKFG